MRFFTSTTCVLVLSGLLGPRPASAQNVTGIGESRTTSAGERLGDQARPRIAVPVTVGADLGDGDQKGVAPAIGFQLWQTDKFFLGAFFTMAATDPTVTEGFGGFVLNPPLKGRSFYVSGNYVVLGKSDPANNKETGPVLVGVGGRWGTTSTKFELTPAPGTTVTTDGFGTVASITAQIVSRTARMSGGDSESKSEFQLGLELGPTWRLLGGDVSENDAIRRQLLGTEKSTFVGFETTFFVRVNQMQPFARFSYFSRPDGIPIPGLTGRQVVWGINVASAIFSGVAE